MPLKLLAALLLVITSLTLPALSDAPATQPTTHPAADIPWGNQADGLACRLTLPTSPCVGQSIPAIVEVKNVSDHPLKVLDELDPIYPKIAKFDITGPKGNVKITCSGDCGFLANQWKLLQKGDVLRWELTDLRAYFVFPHAGLGDPGKYQVAYTLKSLLPDQPAGEDPYWKGTASSNPVALEVTPLTPEDLTVHEWGVFSIFSDIQFANADMKAEWASMPNDFYRQFPIQIAPPNDRPELNMRKPILYFYSHRNALNLDVRVGFHDGTPVIWWPFAKNAIPQVTPAFLRKLEWSVSLGNTYATNYNGQMVNAKTGSPWSTAKLFDLPPGSWVQQARIDGPALLTTYGGTFKNGYMMSRPETEKFIYYDGLVPAPNYLAATQKADGLNPSATAPTLTNTAKFPIEGLLLIDRRQPLPDMTERWALIDKLAPGASVTPTFRNTVHGDQPDSPQQSLTALLLARGLTKNETASILKIWQKGFFAHPGLTALYILPQSEYDRLLPLEISPQPGKIIRAGIVLQNHLEGLEAIRTQAQALIAKLGDDDYKTRAAATAALTNLGPVIIPFLQKALQTTTDLEAQTRLKELLSNIDAADYLKTPLPSPPPRPANTDN